ncbi:MAG TPA: ImmA/IrrE family metallo-endopeptidase [Pyrinomonadaceae bacterium]|nr:ImmA/IrrE family metallo-endopeptidase [Pyrinomonadaceae bacterium]
MREVFERGFKSWCERVALKQRSDLRLQAWDALDALRLASHLGVIVWTADQVPGLAPSSLAILTQNDSDSWSAVTLRNGARDLIILNPSHAKSRQASDVMHELAHIILGHEPARVDVSEDGLLILNSYGKQQEEEAKWLSGCLLLPREALLLIRRRRISQEAAASIYGVSVPMLTYRQNVLNLRGGLRRRPIITKH